jgi:hypothetical protein
MDPLPYDQKERRLAELNIEQQIKNLSKLELIQKPGSKVHIPNFMAGIST